VQAILEGLTQADGYRVAGYKASNPDTVYTEAHRLMRHPQISPRLAYLRTRAADESVLTKAWLIEQARDTYASARAAGHHAAALKALQMLGLERATFIPKQEVRRPGDFSEMSDNELRQYVEREMAEFGISRQRKPGPRGSGNTGGAVH
jgi:hypothetical protein